MMKESMEITMVGVEDLHIDPSNARTGHDIDQIMASIKEFGFADPIEAQQATGRIIAGNGRYLAAKQMKMAHVPVVWHDMNDLEATRYGIANNRLTDKSEWDMDVLPDLLAEVGTDIPGLDDDFLATLDMGDTVAPVEDPGPDIDRADELQEKWQTETGQVWQIGEHRLMCGDSTAKESVSKLLTVKPILMVTDPPYGVEYDPAWRNDAAEKGLISYAARSVGTVQNDDRCDWTEAYELSEAQVAYVWHADRHASEVQQSIEQAGYVIVSQLIWAKPMFAISRGDYHWQHEPCWYAHKKGKTHNWQGDRSQSTLWEIERGNGEKTGHGTEKPVECMARPMRNNTQDGDAVYDPFLGSGTTMVAAEQLGRKCYGMEIDPKYCAVILERMSLMVDNIKLTI